MPFAEMTIPALREKEFSSKMAELEKYQEESSFTLYLTSYDSEGLKINGLLTIPKGEAPSRGWPAIVFVHGYIAPTMYETTTRYTDYINALARNGFVVFKIDLRGHGDSEGEAGGAYYSSDYVIDTLNAYSALQNADFVDPKAIGLWGHSMAGNVTSRSMAAKPNIPALVVWAGAGYTYSDLQDYMINDQSYRPPTQSTARAQRRQLLRDTHGDFDANNLFWSQVAITNYLKDLEGAISVHHPADDNVVSVEYTRNLKKLLDENNVTSEVYEYTSGGHNLTGSTFTTAMSRTIDFFHKYLK
jgi:dipeptidyl aminopeptidase/acylaminoacyl peptidase